MQQPPRKAQVARQFSVGRVNQSALVAAGDHQRARFDGSAASDSPEGFDVALLLRRARYVAG